MQSSQLPGAASSSCFPDKEKVHMGSWSASYLINLNFLIVSSNIFLGILFLSRSGHPSSFCSVSQKTDLCGLHQRPPCSLAFRQSLTVDSVQVRGKKASSVTDVLIPQVASGSVVTSYRCPSTEGHSACQISFDPQLLFKNFIVDTLLQVFPISPPSAPTT